MPKENYIKICPKCGSSKVSVSGNLYGTTDYCKGCGYSSSMFPEVKESEVREFRKELKERK